MDDYQVAQEEKEPSSISPVCFIGTKKCKKHKYSVEFDIYIGPYHEGLYCTGEGVHLIED